MTKNSIACSCKVQVFVKLLLVLTKIPVPKFAFPLVTPKKTSKKQMVEKCQPSYLCLAKQIDSIMENDVIFLQFNT